MTHAVVARNSICVFYAKCRNPRESSSGRFFFVARKLRKYGCGKIANFIKRAIAIDFFFFLHISFNKRSFRCTRENEITSKCQIKDLSLITDLFLNSIIIIYFTDKFIENLVRDKTERETYDSLLE